MNTQSTAGKFAQWVTVPVLLLAMGAGVAQAQRGQDSRHDDHYQNRGDRGDRGDRGNRGNHGDRGNRGNDFHFRDQDRGRFESHYRKDINRWRGRRNRPHFSRGQRIPMGYRIQPVPRAYYAQIAPPPPGYQYGYYDGYVVAYDPTTRIIADVMDLVAGAASSY